jgi:transcriptional regulator with GAF, ATPase, and Fis domain
MTVADQSLVSLALDVGKLSASDLDLPAVLTRVCTVLATATGVAGAVILVTEPSEEEPTLVASSGKAEWVGEAQRRTRSGPLTTVLRSRRPQGTLDLARSAPPPLAAAVARSGLVGSLAVPLEANGDVYGAVQLLGTAGHPVEPRQVDLVRLLLDVLVARLVDVRALRLARSAVETVAPARGIEVATAVIPAPRGPAARPPRPEAAPIRPAAPNPAEDGTRRLPARRPEQRRPGRHALDARP